MKIGDPGVCYFCEDESVRFSSSSVFDVELECCDHCGEAVDGVLRLLERRLPGAPTGESPETLESRAAEYDEHAEQYERTAREAIADLFGVRASDPELVRAVRAIAASAVSETMSRLIRLGKA